MYIVYVFEDGLGWKLESLQPTAEEAEFYRIHRCLEDGCERDIKRIVL